MDESEKKGLVLQYDRLHRAYQQDRATDREKRQMESILNRLQMTYTEVIRQAERYKSTKSN